MLGKKMTSEGAAGGGNEAFQKKLALFMEAGARIKAEQDARKEADLKLQKA